MNVSWQFLRYALIGIATNLGGYAIYLTSTFMGTPPKPTMSVLYCLGAAAGFYANRRITFSHQGHLASAGVRYIVAYLMGYLLNFSLLVAFVDVLGYPHQWVQAFAIILVAFVMFFLLKRYVFPASTAKGRSVS